MSRCITLRMVRTPSVVLERFDPERILEQQRMCETVRQLTLAWALIATSIPIPPCHRKFAIARRTTGACSLPSRTQPARNGARPSERLRSNCTVDAMKISQCNSSPTFETSSIVVQGWTALGVRSWLPSLSSWLKSGGASGAAFGATGHRDSSQQRGWHRCFRSLAFDPGQYGHRAEAPLPNRGRATRERSSTMLGSPSARKKAHRHSRTVSNGYSNHSRHTVTAHGSEL